MTNQPIEPPDVHYINAAQGWLELGLPHDAKAELQKVSPRYFSHPEVLHLAWHIHAKLQEWDTCIDTARELLRAAPNWPGSWINLGNSLFFKKNFQAAYDHLLPALALFPENPSMPYNLACYTCQMGKITEARRWLAKAITLGDPQQIRQLALSDVDLQPLWDELRTDQGLLKFKCQLPAAADSDTEFTVE